MMLHILDYKLPALAAVFLALGWFFSGSGPERAATVETDATPGWRTASAGATSARTALAARSPLAGMQSPFAAFGPVSASASVPTALAESGEQRIGIQFEPDLRAYDVGALSSEEKRRIRKGLHGLKRDPLARAFIIDTFFSSNQPQLAQSMYALIRDAKLKDVGLLEELIQRESSAPAASAGTSTKARIVDLIADLGTRNDAPYSAQIDGYLAQLASHPDPQLRNAAVSQRIWYLNQHQPYNIALQEQYLTHSVPTIREEVYSLIEARIASQTLIGQAQLGAALNAALRSDQPGMTGEERARASALLQTLSGGPVAL